MIAGNFRGLIFVDTRNHAHYTLYNRTYFVGLIFTDSSVFAKIAKIGPLKNFPLYGTLFQWPFMYICTCTCTYGRYFYMCLTATIHARVLCCMGQLLILKLLHVGVLGDHGATVDVP